MIINMNAFLCISIHDLGNKVSKKYLSQSRESIATLLDITTTTKKNNLRMPFYENKGASFAFIRYWALKNVIWCATEAGYFFMQCLSELKALPFSPFQSLLHWYSFYLFVLFFHIIVIIIWIKHLVLRESSRMLPVKEILAWSDKM